MLSSGDNPVSGTLAATTTAASLGSQACWLFRVQCRRYAVENAEDRLTLDTCVHTDLGKHLPFNVLEFKSTEPDDPPEPLAALRPIKLSRL
jgi:hypothetical protein